MDVVLKHEMETGFRVHSVTSGAVDLVPDRTTTEHLKSPETFTGCIPCCDWNRDYYTNPFPSAPGTEPQKLPKINVRSFSLNTLYPAPYPLSKLQSQCRP